MNKLLSLVVIMFLTACGGGGGGSDPISAPAPPPSPPPAFTPPAVTPIDISLLAGPDIVINSQNAKEDILENIVFSLEFLRDFVDNVASSVLVGNLANNQSLESLSSQTATQTCTYSLVDNDNSNSITSGDVIDVVLENCPSTQQLSGAFYGDTQINVTSVIDDGTQLVIEANLSMEGLTFRASNDAVIAANGTVFIRQENPVGDFAADVVYEVTSAIGGAVQFVDTDDNRLIMREPLFRLESPVASGATYTLGAALVADTSLGGSYACSPSSIEAFTTTNFPSSGTLIRCEGEPGSVASVTVVTPGSSMANLNVGATITLVEWADFLTLSLATAFGIN